MFESWRVSSPASSAHVTILGHELSHPTANADAIVILVLAALGAIAIALAIAGAARELGAARRFSPRLGPPDPRIPQGVLVIDDERPRAFCAGLLRPRVYISTGALTVLDDAALAAVLTHEAHHAGRRDPLRLAVGRVLSRALFFVPGLAALTRSQQALAELSADERATHSAPEGRSALARAMLAFCDSAQSGHEAGIDPERIDHLLGEPPTWRFPAALCIAALAVIVLVLGVAILAGRAASGSASLAPPLLSAQPCIVALALIPAGVAAVLAGLRRTARA